MFAQRGRPGIRWRSSGARRRRKRGPGPPPRCRTRATAPVAPPTGAVSSSSSRPCVHRPRGGGRRPQVRSGAGPQGPGPVPAFAAGLPSERRAPCPSSRHRLDPLPVLPPAARLRRRPGLLDELLRLAAAAGVEPRSRRTRPRRRAPGPARRWCSSASDLAAASPRPACRAARSVALVSTDLDDAGGLAARGRGLGAQRGRSCPTPRSGWSTLLADAVRSGPRWRRWSCVVGGRGGAGASTLAARARAGRASGRAARGAGRRRSARRWHRPRPRRRGRARGCAGPIWPGPAAGSPADLAGGALPRSTRCSCCPGTAVTCCTSTRDAIESVLAAARRATTAGRRRRPAAPVRTRRPQVALGAGRRARCCWSRPRCGRWPRPGRVAGGSYAALASDVRVVVRGPAPGRPGRRRGGRRPWAATGRPVPAPSRAWPPPWSGVTPPGAAARPARRAVRRHLLTTASGRTSRRSTPGADGRSSGVDGAARAGPGPAGARARSGPPTPAAVAAALRAEGRVLGDRCAPGGGHRCAAPSWAAPGRWLPCWTTRTSRTSWSTARPRCGSTRAGGLERVPVRFRDDAAVRRLAQRLAAAAGRRLDDAVPWCDARLPDGVRLHAVLAAGRRRGTCLSLRVPARRACDAGRPGRGRERSRRRGAELLRRWSRARVSFLVTGGTGTGKTTVLAALLALVPRHERVLVVEDSGELRPDHPHVVLLEARPANVEGSGRSRWRDLVRQACGCVRTGWSSARSGVAEVVDLLAALNTGHEGGCGTVHANAAADLPARLEALALRGRARARGRALPARRRGGSGGPCRPWAWRRAPRRRDRRPRPFRGRARPCRDRDVAGRGPAPPRPWGGAAGGAARAGGSSVSAWGSAGRRVRRADSAAGRSVRAGDRQAPRRPADGGPAPRGPMARGPAGARVRAPGRRAGPGRADGRDARVVRRGAAGRRGPLGGPRGGRRRGRPPRPER